MAQLNADRLFHVIFLLGMLALVGVRRMYFVRLRRARKTTPVRGNPIVRELRQLGALIGFLVIAVHTFRPALLGWSDVQLPDLLRAVGTAGLIASVPLFVWIVRAATPPEPPGPGRGGPPTLTTTRPYQHARHPLYAATILATASLVLVSANWVVAAIGMMLIAHIAMIRIPREEAELAEAFGEDYIVYAAGTRRLLPFPRAH